MIGNGIGTVSLAEPNQTARARQELYGAAVL